MTDDVVYIGGANANAKQPKSTKSTASVWVSSINYGKMNFSLLFLLPLPGITCDEGKTFSVKKYCQTWKWIESEMSCRLHGKREKKRRRRRSRRRPKMKNRRIKINLFVYLVQQNEMSSKSMFRNNSVAIIIMDQLRSIRIFLRSLATLFAGRKSPTKGKKKRFEWKKVRHVCVCAIVVLHGNVTGLTFLHQ